MNKFEILYLLTSHFICDYVFQTTQTGLRKSKEHLVLIEHVAFYFMGMLVFMVPLAIYRPIDLLSFCAINALAHLITDFFTSRLSAKYYKEGRLYAFWKVIGIDQLLHYTVLFLTYP